MKFVAILCVFCSFAAPASAAWTAKAFTFTNYDLSVHLDPDQHRIPARGKITLRNDSSSPQKYVSLQISSSLEWQAIKINGAPVGFYFANLHLGHRSYGALSEAIVTLPMPIAPKAAIEIEVGYEGVVVQDATRVTRIGVPETAAKHSEWDQIGKSFTAVRGIGYVTWYPVAVESASLSEGNSVEDAVGRWKVRTAEATMALTFKSTGDGAIYFSGVPSDAARDAGGNAQAFSVTPGTSVPTFVDCELSEAYAGRTLDCVFPARTRRRSENLW